MYKTNFRKAVRLQKCRAKMFAQTFATEHNHKVVKEMEEKEKARKEEFWKKMIAEGKWII